MQRRKEAVKAGKMMFLDRYRAESRDRWAVDGFEAVKEKLEGMEDLGSGEAWRSSAFAFGNLNIEVVMVKWAGGRNAESVESADEVSRRMREAGAMMFLDRYCG